MMYWRNACHIRAAKSGISGVYAGHPAMHQGGFNVLLHS